MPLASDDVRPGTVAYFDVAILNNDSRVTRPPSPTTRGGPFLCFAVSHGIAGWTPISSQSRPERLELIRSWRSGGSGAWTREAQFVNDGSTTYLGPADVFVAAAANQDLFDVATRPRVSEAGIKAVLAEITKRHGAQP